MEITNKGVGQFKLGTILENEYNKQELDITLNSNNEIETIIITSEKYKTKDGFGVGTKIQEIKIYLKILC